MTENEYRAYPALNYSTLAALDKDPLSTQKEKEVTYDMLEGKALDKMIFDKDNFLKEYYILPENNILKDNALATAEEVYNMSQDYEPDRSIIINAARNNNYYDNYKDEEKLYNRVWKNIKNHHVALVEAGNKYRITNDTYIWCLQAKEALLSNEFTKKYFHTDDSNTKITFQKPLIWKEVINGKDFEFKGLLDIEIRNDVEKWVQMIDLKKVGRKTFESDFYSNRYYLQEGMYKEGLQKSYPDYTIISSVFVTAYRKDPYRPDVFHISPSQHSMHVHGGYLPSGKFLKGYLQLAEEFKWHSEINKWDYSKEVYESDGKHLNKLTTNDFRTAKQHL